MKHAATFLLSVLFLYCGISYGALSTHSFTDAAGRGSHPQTLTFGSRIIINLSAISGATVYRAIFNPNRKYGNGGGYPSSLAATRDIIITSKAGDTLQILGPRFRTFDATLAVQQALAIGNVCTLNVLQAADMGNYDNDIKSLDVLCNRAAAATITQVTNASARFKDGDAMITFSEVNPIFTTTSTTCDQYNTAMGAISGGTESPKVRYRIYRSLTPLTSESAVINAELIDETTQLTGWDAPYFGMDNCTGTKIVPRYPTNDLVLAAPGTGIYVNRFKGTGSETAYYFVSHSVDGAEDFSTLTEGVNATASVVESPGYGMVVKREVQAGVSFQYINNATLNYYVKWECPPAHNTPNAPYDYLVAVPQNVIAKPMAQVSLHCWGGSIDGCYPGWSRNSEGGLLISTNQYPYDWWTAYHENAGTYKPFTKGTVQPFTEVRYLSFVFDFAVPAYNIDTNRILLAGQSMGGSGASLWGLRSGHIFSNIFGYVGVHIAKESPTFTGSFAGSYGDTSWHCKYSNEALERFGYPVIHPSDNIDVWDYWDNTKWLAANMTTETPWMSHSNGVNDGGIGWPQAWKNTQSLVATKRGFNFHWGQDGHGTTVTYMNVDHQKNKSYPAFENGSLNQSLGSAPGQETSAGDINLYVRWDPATNVDLADRWEMTIWLDAGASQGTETVDITPRRLQQLMHGAGSTYTWEFVEGVTPVASGNATADANGLITITGLTLSKTHRTLKINCTNCTLDAQAIAATENKYAIMANPNPFNPAVMITITNYELKITNPELKIFKINGELVKDLSSCIRNSKFVIRNSVSWDASNQPSGVYIIKAKVGNKVLSKQVMLLK